MGGVGVLALQGDFAEHLAMLGRCGTEGVAVRTFDELEGVEALILPGGESTTILKLIDRFDLRERLSKRIEEGMPVFGTCAGAIILARRTSDGEPPLGVLDMTVRRNAYGRQVDSFEAEVEVDGIEGGPVRAVFIRAPSFEEIGPGGRVLSRWANQPVVVESGRILVSAFHPELTEDTRLHAYFLQELCEKRAG